MRQIHKFALLMVGVMLPNLYACNAFNVPPSAEPSAMLPTEAKTPIPLSTPTYMVLADRPTPTAWLWLPYNNNPTNNGCGEFITTLPVEGTEELSQKELTQKLFEVYLGHYKSSGLGSQCRLEDFKVEAARIGSVTFSVQIKEEPSDWIAGNGDLSQNGWIIHKTLLVGIEQVDSQYVLKIYGTG